MARKRGGMNLSEEIRKYVGANAEAKPMEVAEGLAKAGIKTTAQYVSTIMSNDRKKAGKGKGKRRGRRAGVSRVQGDVLANLVLAKKLADKLGGINEARAALDTLAKVLS